jgi:hypothetical protein
MINASHNNAALFGRAKRDPKPGRLLLSFLKLLIPAMIFLFRAQTASAQDETDYAVHANIIYHFTKYIDWPEDKKSGNFIIGVMGNSHIYEELKKNIADKMVDHQKIVIKTFSSSASSFNCHILYIGDDESGNIKKIAAKTAGTPTLLVSESEGLARKGSCINFVIVSDRLKLEINITSIEQRNLDVASELLLLGKIVK